MKVDEKIRMFKFFKVRVPLPLPMLGRWKRNDNVDIKATLANIDSCGDRLCGDVKQTRVIIDKYHRPKDVTRKVPYLKDS